MSSQTQRDRESATAPQPQDAGDSGAPAGHGPAERRAGRGRDHRRWPVVLLAVLLVLALAAVGYLAYLSRAWEQRADDVDAVARDLGAELADTRAELEETQGTLALVESQLDGAQQQIHELADTAAQFGDDREVQRQVAEYREELLSAATGVTGTMGECISAQSEYTVAVEGELSRAAARLQALQDGDDEQPTPETTEGPDLAELRQDLVESCQAAAEAQAGLQQRLENS